MRCTAIAFALLTMLLSVHSDAAPRRVVSLDYCADQFVLQLLPRERILALSPDATEPFAYLRELAAGIPQVRPRAEDVLLLEPDLVVASYGASAHMERLLGRAGIALARVGWIEDLASVRSNLIHMGDALGNAAGARALLEDFDRRLARLAPAAAATGPRALYLTPGGVTGGPGTVIDELLQAAGLENFAGRPGWQSLPLERLAYEQPDLVVSASFVADQHPWSAARHPLLRRQLTGVPTVALPGAWTACGGWFLIEAIEAMAEMAVAAP
jgi:iron complex transport system substrate-binding protein